MIKIMMGLVACMVFVANAQAAETQEDWSQECTFFKGIAQKVATMRDNGTSEPDTQKYNLEYVKQQFNGAQQMVSALHDLTHDVYTKEYYVDATPLRVGVISYARCMRSLGSK